MSDRPAVGLLCWLHRRPAYVPLVRSFELKKTSQYGTPRISSVAQGLNSFAAPVYRGYTLTRVTHGTHGLDRDLVPLADV